MYFVGGTQVVESSGVYNDTGYPSARVAQFVRDKRIDHDILYIYGGQAPSPLGDFWKLNMSSQTFTWLISDPNRTNATRTYGANFAPANNIYPGRRYVGTCFPADY